MKLILIVSLGFSAAAAQDTGAWRAVQQMEKCKVKVERFDGKTVKGAFVRAGDDSIVVATKDAEVVVPKADVRKVRCGGHGGLLLGLLSGTIASSIWGISDAVKHKDELFGEHMEFGHAMLTLTPVAAGAAIGIAVDAGKRPVYVAPAPLR